MASEPSARVGRVIARLARQVELGLAPLDLSLSQYRVLSFLSDGSAAASALADKLTVTRPSVTGVVDGLVARGLVQRDPDPDDRRRVGHRLTGEGHRVLAAADAEVERRLRDVAQYAEPATTTTATTAATRALDALLPWQTALDAYRDARHAGAPMAGARR